MHGYKSKNDPDTEGKELVPFRLLLLKRLMQQIGTIPWDNPDGVPVQLEEEDTERRESRVQRGVSLFGGDEFDGKIPLVSILETFGNQYVVGPTGLESLARDNISSRLLDSLDIGPPDSTGGPTEWKLVIQGWVNDQKNPGHPLDPLYELLASVQQTLEGVRENKFWYFFKDSGHREMLTSDPDGFRRPLDSQGGIVPFPSLDPEDMPPEGEFDVLNNGQQQYMDWRLDLWEPRSILGAGGEHPMVDTIEFGRGVVRPADEPSHRAGFVLEVVLTLVEDFSKPFVEDI